ncbi:hypothetical protein DPMN_172951 [Dreissena polymorpha]|uniref:Uncharacterized protein n=1 Tax=Dreissena polymorpha TaxID=45954 RepID=A0A9D4E377_DREPO|nr:hypothetical protein DPMN_172951 [Dreissena polymorpha]
MEVSRSRTENVLPVITGTVRPTTEKDHGRSMFVIESHAVQPGPSGVHCPRALKRAAPVLKLDAGTVPVVTTVTVRDSRTNCNPVNSLTV